MNNPIDYSVITESPNLKATDEQIARLYQRYHFARQVAKDKDILEVACGSGIGLGYLAQVANKVIGVDIEEKNVELARNCYKGDGRFGGSEGERLRSREGEKVGRWEDFDNEKLRSCEDGKLMNGKIDIQIMDAHDLHFPDTCFDLILLYEAIYYLKDPEKFISEAERVLRKDGRLIICTVNKDWEDFHPSPYTHRYFSAPELCEILKGKFNAVMMYGGFPVNNSGVKNKVISRIKRMAVDFHLIPGSLKARAYLKRIFMGRLIPLPSEVYEDMAAYEAPVSIPVDKANKDFKIIYAVASK